MICRTVCRRRARRAVGCGRADRVRPPSVHGDRVAGGSTGTELDRTCSSDSIADTTRHTSTSRTARRWTRRRGSGRSRPAPAPGSTRTQAGADCPIHGQGEPKATRPSDLWRARAGLVLERRENGYTVYRSCPVCRPQRRRETWVWVSLSYATFGLRVEHGRVVEAPPIARWTVGLSGGTGCGLLPEEGRDLRASESQLEERSNDESGSSGTDPGTGPGPCRLGAGHREGDRHGGTVRCAGQAIEDACCEVLRRRTRHDGLRDARRKADVLSNANSALIDAIGGGTSRTGTTSRVVNCPR